MSKFIQLIALLCLLAGTAFAQGDGQMFTVQDVPLDKTAENAAVAREQALAEGQREAFKMLAARMMSAEDFKTFTVPDTAAIAPMIEDFEIRNEQLSTTQYVATMTVSFKPDSVRSFFSGQNVLVADVPSNPVLILPVYQDGTRTELWEDVNPWRTAWVAMPGQEGPVPVYLPVGDIEDMASVSAEKVMSGDYAPVFALQKKYQARDVVIPVAHKSDDGALLIDIYEYLTGDMNRVKTLTVPQPTDPAVAVDLFQEGVKAVTAYLQERWKEKVTGQPAGEGAAEANTLRADVFFSQIQQWVEIQNKLRGIDLVTASNVLSLNRDRAELEITWRGTKDDLVQAFTSQGLSLDAPAVEINDVLEPGSQDLVLPKYEIKLLMPVTTVAPMVAP